MCMRYKIKLLLFPGLLFLSAIAANILNNDRDILVFLPPAYDAAKIFTTSKPKGSNIMRERGRSALSQSYHSFFHGSCKIMPSASF